MKQIAWFKSDQNGIEIFLHEITRNVVLLSLSSNQTKMGLKLPLLDATSFNQLFGSNQTKMGLKGFPEARCYELPACVQIRPKWD